MYARNVNSQTLSSSLSLSYRLVMPVPTTGCCFFRGYYVSVNYNWNYARLNRPCFFLSSHSFASVLSISCPFFYLFLFSFFVAESFKRLQIWFLIINLVDACFWITHTHKSLNPLQRVAIFWAFCKLNMFMFMLSLKFHHVEKQICLCITKKLCAQYARGRVFVTKCYFSSKIENNFFLLLQIEM